MKGIEPESFLRDHWQKKPLFLRQAMRDGLPLIDQDELAWLATLDDVESRLVFTEHGDDRTRYRVEHGPFDESSLRELPDSNWTLLVNDVEKHLPELRPIVECVGFIPDWRIDDLMVSFAAPGGSVGPHRDNYDVFLCQGEGTRQWRLSGDDVAPDPGACDGLVLLSEFDGECVDARTGDVLYLPPNLPHWGVAVDACLTYSIGMRAPRVSDLVESCSEPIDDPFYEDADLAIAEAVPGYISRQSVRRVRDLLSGSVSLPDARLAALLGCFVTRPKEWLRPEGMADDGSAEQAVQLHGMARIAWDDRRVYLNGESKKLQDDERQLVAGLCAKRALDREDLPNWRRLADRSGLLRWLHTHGAFEPGN